ncbi:restriction endonuclease subunit S [Flavobacterium arcticum]|nr:restriction endonuclease subunit S [Flavobacterium arcticum]KAF2510374.1 restriction endonuclease subunit S [Flavobacterium arcticum]
MAATTKQNISFIKFSELYNWSPSHLIGNHFNYNKEFPLMKIGKFLKKSNNIIVIEDNKTYKRVTVKINNGGVILRNTEIGKNIGTKRQFLVKGGQFIISKIDARNGAMGIIPEELDGAIVTNDFPTYEIDTNTILEQFLLLITTTKKFTEFAQSCSSGTTNRQRIDLKKFLDVQIPLPPLNDADAKKQGLPNIITQEKLVAAYNQKIATAAQAKQDALAKEIEVETYLYNELGIQKTEKKETKKGLHFVKFKDMEEWGYGRSTELLSLKSTKYSVISLNKNEFLYIDLFRGKSPKYDQSESYILNQKCIRWNYIDTQYMKSVKKEWLEKIESKFLTKTGDILINSTGDGTIGRSTVVRDTENNLLYDSHILLLRLNKKYILPEYFVEIFNSSYGQNQIETVKSAQSTKQTELGLTNLKKIHFPIIEDINTQKTIIDNIENLRKEIKTLKKQYENLREQAIIDFENIIFKK